jgi:hypothetical protein
VTKRNENFLVLANELTTVALKVIESRGVDLDQLDVTIREEIIEAMMFYLVNEIWAPIAYPRGGRGNPSSTTKGD